MPYLIDTGIKTLEGQLDERIRTALQLREQMNWAVSDQTKRIIEAQLSQTEDEIHEIENQIQS